MAKEAARLGVLGFGLALGVMWGVGMLLVGLFGWQVNYGVDFVNAMGSVYIGFGPTLKGSLLGALWGFVDGFIGGVVLAWLYNMFTCNSRKCKPSDS